MAQEALLFQQLTSKIEKYYAAALTFQNHKPKKCLKANIRWRTKRVYCPESFVKNAAHLNNPIFVNKEIRSL